jgi:thiol-disulfide isomerase/thioredoxin
MKRREALGCIAAAAWLAGCGSGDSADPRARWPALPVRDLTGRPTTLPRASGSVRVINVWALWCPPCRQELPGLARLASALAPKGIEVSAIALADDIFPVREYVAQNVAGLRSLVLSPSAPASGQLGLDSLPQTFVVAPNSTVLACWVGARDWDSDAVRAQLERVVRGA